MHSGKNGPLWWYVLCVPRPGAWQLSVSHLSWIGELSCGSNTMLDEADNTGGICEFVCFRCLYIRWYMEFGPVALRHLIFLNPFDCRQKKCQLKKWSDSNTVGFNFQAYILYINIDIWVYYIYTFSNYFIYNYRDSQDELHMNSL